MGRRYQPGATVLLRALPYDLDLVFANPDGTPLKPDSVSASVSLLFRKLKLPKGTSLHSLRHTHASELLDIGVSLPVVSARLGHSSVRVTADIYSHAIDCEDDDAARRWEDQLDSIADIITPGEEGEDEDDDQD